MKRIVPVLMVVALAGCAASPTDPGVTPLNYGSCTASDRAAAVVAHGPPQDSVQSAPARVQWWYGLSRAGGGNAGQSVPLVTFAGELATCQVTVT